MFCKNCGKELGEDVLFCPVCGTKQAEVSVEMTEEQEEVFHSEAFNSGESGPTAETAAERTSAENRKTEEKVPGGNIISKIWNSPLFTKIAIKFGNILEIMEGIIFLFLCRNLFKEGGFWGIAFGIVFALAGIGGCISGAMSLLSRRKKDGAEESTEEMDNKELNKKKRNLCIGVVVIVIALAVFKNTGGGTYVMVQAISFDDMGTETIGELVDKNIKGPEWSQVKLDKNSKLVSVEGYCPSYGERVRVEFYYEELKDGSYEVSLSGISLPESNEELDTFDAYIMWASFYQ